MPNWCFTEYRCCGKKGELVDLKEKLDHLNSLPAPLVDNGFGKLRCGCLVSLLGGDWNEVYCRGELSEPPIFEGTTLRFSVMNAWSELGEWRKFIKSKYPNIYIVYSSEESGNVYYVTNDVEGDYFPERYILDFTEGIEYFNTLEAAAEYVKNLTGKDVKTEEEIDAALNEQEEKEMEKDDDSFYSFNKFKVMEEDEP